MPATIDLDAALKAITDAREEDPSAKPQMIHIRALRNYRLAMGGSLIEARDAINAAFTHEATTPDLDQYGKPVGDGWAYKFPNGHTASVVVDARPQNRFRFEVLSSDPADAGNGGIAAGLTTAEVEAKLAALYHLPNR